VTPSEIDQYHRDCLEFLEAKKKYSIYMIEWNEKDAENFNQFKHDALTEAGLLHHQKANQIFSYIWEEKHSGGYEEVCSALIEIADLFSE